MSTKIHDGSQHYPGQTAAVVPGSQAAAANDPALVVTLSPNSGGITSISTENITQWQGAGVTGGTGAGGPGIPRVTTSFDSSLAIADGASGTTKATVLGTPNVDGTATGTFVGSQLVSNVGELFQPLTGLYDRHIEAPGMKLTTGTTGTTGATGGATGAALVSILDVQQINGSNGFSLNGSTGVLCTFWTHGAQSLNVHQTVATGGPVWVVESSEDGVTWTVVFGAPVDGVNLLPSTSNSGANGVRNFVFPVVGPQMRIRSSTAGTTLTVVPSLRHVPFVAPAARTFGTPCASGSVASGASYTNLTATGTTTVKSGAGTLYGIAVNALPAGNQTTTLTIYDNTSGSGTKIGTVVINGPTGTAENIGATTLMQTPVGVAFSTGLTVVITGTGASVADVTFLYS